MKTGAAQDERAKALVGSDDSFVCLFHFDFAAGLYSFEHLLVG